MQRAWVDLGYEAVDTVLQHGQFSRRGGILDVWTPAEAFPVRIEFFGDEIDTLRQFDPGSQRTIRPMDDLLITPAREVLPDKSDHEFPPNVDVDEFYIPVIHPASSTLLDYLPRQTLILVDNLANLESFGEEIEEQAIRMRAESVTEGTISPDFPIPYETFSEINDTIQTRRWIELGSSTAPEDNPFGEIFTLGNRFGGQLKTFLNSLEELKTGQNQALVVTRQLSRLKELWAERQEPENPFDPQFLEGTLSEGWNLA
ncbi:hypothetical protein FDZ73_25120, partial [bacterium]